VVALIVPSPERGQRCFWNLLFRPYLLISWAVFNCQFPPVNPCGDQSQISGGEQRTARRNSIGGLGNGSQPRRAWEVWVFSTWVCLTKPCWTLVLALVDGTILYLCKGVKS
jgi:hypothetical protein